MGPCVKNKKPGPNGTGRIAGKSKGPGLSSYIAARALP